MRRLRHTLCWLAAALVALALGCSAGRGPSNAGGGGRPSSGSGPLAALPPPAPDPLGYDLASAAVNGVAGGRVSALAPQPGTSAASLIAHEPLHAVASVGSLTPATEVSLPFPLSSLASVGTLGFAGTRDPAVAGAGDVYRRTETAGVPAWTRILDGGVPGAVVGATANELLVAQGGPVSSASLLRLAPASAAVVDSTALGSLDPRAVVEYPAGSGTVYVGGAAGNDVALVRVRAGALEPVALPVALPAAGTRQEVSALLRVPALGGGELLVIAVASFDATSGAPLEGSFFLHDGLSPTGLPGLGGDAALALAFQDDTLVAGSATGRLLLLDPATTWQDVPGFPAVEQVTSLFARDRRTLLVGCRSAAGAVLVVRTGRSP